MLEIIRIIVRAGRIFMGYPLIGFYHRINHEIVRSGQNAIWIS